MQLFSFFSPEQSREFRPQNSRAEILVPSAASLAANFCAARVRLPAEFFYFIGKQFPMK